MARLICSHACSGKQEKLVFLSKFTVHMHAFGKQGNVLWEAGKRVVPHAFGYAII
jgi:hypothetical protein